MKRHFDEDLQSLRERLLHMGALAEEMTQLAFKLLTGGDEELLEKLDQLETQINQLQIEIDEKCLTLIALHQPTAGDLRLIAAALKITSDLERVGDQAVNIGETAMYLQRQPALKIGDIPRMVQVATEMLKDSLDAFSRKDVELARAVIRRDDEEDRLKSEVFAELLHLMQNDASTIQRAIDLILVSRNLERIADHATNIAEDVVYMVLGKDIRHPADQEAAAKGAANP